MFVVFFLILVLNVLRNFSLYRTSICLFIEWKPVILGADPIEREERITFKIKSVRAPNNNKSGLFGWLVGWLVS